MSNELKRRRDNSTQIQRFARGLEGRRLATRWRMARQAQPPYPGYRRGLPCAHDALRRGSPCLASRWHWHGGVGHLLVGLVLGGIQLGLGLVLLVGLAPGGSGCRLYRTADLHPPSGAAIGTSRGFGGGSSGGVKYACATSRPSFGRT